MAREAHSASSIQLGARCEHAWALRYIAGLKEPEYAWDDPKAPPRARAAALGKEVHRRLERYLLGHDDVNWEDRPGQIAASGVRHLPRPEDVAQTEYEFEVEFDGVKWRGLIDFRTHSGLLGDHKTTKSIAGYAHTSETLARDVQAALYKVATPEHAQAGRTLFDRATHRWVYYQTDKQKLPASRKVECTLTRKDAVKVLRDPEILERDDVLRARDMRERKRLPMAPSTLAKHLDTIKSVDHARQNRLSCWDYGGCLYHVSQGGPCTVARSVGAYLALDKERKEIKNMATEKEDKFAKAAGRAKARSAAPVDEDEGSEVESTETEDAAPAPARGRGRPPKGKAAPVDGPGARAAALVALTPKLQKAQAKFEKAQADLDAAQAELGAVFDEQRTLLG